MLQGPGLLLTLALATPASADTLDLFVMSFCPYGTAAEVQVLEAVERLHGEPVLRLWFIGRDREAPSNSAALKDSSLTREWRRNLRAGADASPAELATAPNRCEDRAQADSVGSQSDELLGRFTSLHGAEEVREDARQTAIASLWPDRLARYLRCRAGTPDHEPGFEACARAAGLDSAAVELEAFSPRGVGRLAANLAKAGARGIRASPTLLVNGQEYAGPMTAATIVRSLCKGASRPLCASQPACESDADCEETGMEGRCIDPGTPKARCETSPPPAVHLTVISDSLCSFCNETFLIEQARAIFPGLVVDRLEASSAGGQRLLDSLGVDEVPVLAFDSTAARAQGWTRIAPSLREVGRFFFFDPHLLDAAYLPFRPPASGRVDLLVAGRHREAIRGIRSLRRLIERSGKPVVVHVQYAVRRDPQNPWQETFTLVQDGAAGHQLVPSGRIARFVSPGGPLEIEENLRQLCLNRTHPQAFDRYVDALIENADSTGVLPEPWSILTRLARTDSSLDLGELNRCTQDPANLAEFETMSALTESLGVQVTPTFLVNNRLRLTGLSTVTLRALVKELDLGVPLPDFNARSAAARKPRHQPLHERKR